MQAFSTPRIIISGDAEGCGKSLVCMGLILALRKRNVSVSACINGTSLAQGVLYQRISRRYVRCFDNRLLTDNQLLLSMNHAGVGADVMIIDGREGLYDGTSPGSLRGSDAEIASWSRTPVILVVDSSDLGTSFGAVVRGFKGVMAGCELGGVIANRIQIGEDAETRDRVYYECAMQTFGHDPLVGALPTFAEEIAIPSGPLSQRKNLSSLNRQIFIDLTHAVENVIDLDRIVQIAQSAPPVRMDGVEFRPSLRRCRIAVSEDICFNLCFQDNLELLRFFGAEIVPFSPLADAGVPKRIGAVYLTGAYLNEYGADLAANDSMKRSLQDFANGGGAIYSEGSGTAYLCQAFRGLDSGEWHQGVGVIPATAIPHVSSPVYQDSLVTEDSILGRQGVIIRGIDTREWSVEHEPQIPTTLRSTYGFSTPHEEGYSPGPQIVATFGFGHWGSNPNVAKNFVDAAEVVHKL